MRRGQEPVGIMAGRGIANSGRSEGRVPGVRSRILRSTRLVSVHDAFRQQPLEGRDQTNRRRGCCGVSKGWVEPVVAAPFDDPDCRSAVVCHASRRSASPRQHDSPSPLTVWTRHQTTVRSSNLFGRATSLEHWERQKPDISVLDAATRVRSSSFLGPIQTSNHGGST